MDYDMIYAGAGLLSGIMILMTLITVVVCIALYVICAIYMSKIAEHKGYGHHKWMAWVPILNMYLVGEMVYELDVFGKFKITNLPLVMVIVAIAAGPVAAIPLIGQLLLIAVAVFYVLVYAELFYEYSDGSGIRYLWAWMSIIGIIIYGKKAEQLTKEEQQETGVFK